MIRKILLYIGVIIGVLAGLVVAAMLFFSSPYGQRMLTDALFQRLSETLGTKVSVREISINAFNGAIRLYNARIDDRKGIRMLDVDTLEANVNPMSLLDGEIALSRLKLSGASIIAYKERKDSAANYQFVIDEMTPGKKRLKKKMPVTMDLVRLSVSRTNLKWDVNSIRRKQGDSLDVNHLYLCDFGMNVEGRMDIKNTIDVNVHNFAFNEKNCGASVFVRNMHYRTLRQRNVNMLLKGLNVNYQDKQIRCAKMTAMQTNGFFDLGCPMEINADSLFFHNDNGKPRKNHSRPHRGAFDQGHIDAYIGLKATLCMVKEDSLHATIDNMWAHDTISGLRLRKVNATVDAFRDSIVVRNMNIALQHSVLKIGRINALCKVIPADTAIGRKSQVVLDIERFPLTGKVCLQDIAQPFAPVLRNFTTPLNLKLNIGGTLDRFTFENIHVSTSDGRLRITADGDLCDVTDKYKLCLHFKNIHMDARDGIKEQLVNHFSKQTRLKMMKQLVTLGDVTFNGNLGVFYKRVGMDGTVSCKYANIDFAFDIDGKKKLLTGTMQTDTINLGAIMNVKKVWLGRTTAEFCINTAKTPHANKNKNKKGRLPIGTLKAYIDGAKYKLLTCRNIFATVKSDGATAVGEVQADHSLVDMNVEFDYIQTDNYQGLKVRPKLRLHKKDKNKKSKLLSLFKLKPRKI